MSSNTGAGSGSNDVFDVRKVRRFIELMNEHELSEIDLRQADQRIRLRRGPETVTVAATPPVVMPATGGGAFHAAGGATPPNVKPAGAVDESSAVLIKSPMVGTFYTAATPESPAFVKVGDQVGPETTICIVEAMKVFNEIPAECSGKIVAVLVQTGDPVEFGQPLFRVEPPG
ncbi:MAG: acetyl-CoA carboxylase biotin carboxyl carrier protein [Planctomycetes bacterium]|nr:acetyl-CoA carboxylase biotin carboxyl carrier protein [Planctomycetota bacterium]